MKVLLVANHFNERAVEALATAKAWLEGNGIDVEAASSDDLAVNCTAYEGLVARSLLFDLVCALGGDGTILRAARVVAGTDVPLLGFNYGNVGFLAGATPEALTEALAAFFAGETISERRVMLEARIRYSDGGLETCLALNEIVVGRKDLGRSIQIAVTINGNHLFELQGDGAIVATATGSTAYALAAGGPLLTPGHQGLCVVPICPRPYAAPAIVTAASDVVELHVNAQPGQRAVINVDGLSPAPAASDIVSVQVVKAPVFLSLVRHNTPDFYTSLALLFDGAQHAQ